MDPIGLLEPISGLFPDWLKPLVFIWLAWAVFVCFTLLNPGDGRERWLGYIRAKVVDTYFALLKRFLEFTARAWFKDAPEIQQRQQLRGLGVNTFTEPAFHFSLALAFIYPLFAFLLVWVLTGQGGSVAGVVFLPELALWQRWLTFLGFGGAIFFSYKSTTSVGWQQEFYRLLAVAVAWLYQRLAQQQRRKAWYWILFISVYLSLAFTVIYQISLQQQLAIDKHLASLTLLLFFVILPLLNVVWDWLSLGVTRSLLYAIADRVHGGGRAFFWALLDGVLALGFLFLITLTVTIGIALTNRVAQWGGGPTASIFDLQLLFDGLRVDPLAADYWWLYFMFFYTLVPTLVHMLIAATAVVLWIPRKHLEAWTHNWQDDQHRFDLPKFSLAAAYLAVIVPLALVMPVVFILILLELLFTLGGAHTFGAWLLDLLQTVAAGIDPQLSKPI